MARRGAESDYGGGAMEKLGLQYARRLARHWWSLAFVLIATVASVLQVYWPIAAKMMEDFPVVVWWMVAAAGLVAAGYSVWREDHLSHQVERSELIRQRSVPWRTAKLICQLFDEWGRAEQNRAQNVGKRTAERKREQLHQLVEQLRIEAVNAPADRAAYGEAACEIIAAFDSRPATMYVYEAICECGAMDWLRSACEKDERAEIAVTPPATP